MEPLYTPIEKDKTVFIPDFPTENMTLEDVAATLKTASDMSEKELEEMIQRNFRIFLDDKYLLDYNCRQAVIDVFSNKKFLKALIKVLGSEILSDKIITCCNKVTWDYMSQNDRDFETGELLLSLSDTVNRQVVRVLSAYIPAKLAQMIALARYSSFKMNKNVERANNMIIKYGDNKWITVQKIIDIYGVIFRYTRLSIVFAAIMFDTNRAMFTLEELERYSMISIAILEILEHGMSSQDIATILKNYYNELSFEPRSVRFSMYSNSQTDYPRIYQVLDLLRAQNIIIP